MSKETQKAIVERVLKSIEEEPDSWELDGSWNNKTYTHSSGISIGIHAGPYDIKLNGIYLPIGWWDLRKINKAIKTLRLEKAVRAWDRNELTV